jgi:hypothetical protein
MEYEPTNLRMEACLEYALGVGRDRPDSAWILTDFDTWVANPFYSGPPDPPHPEDLPVD